MFFFRFIAILTSTLAGSVTFVRTSSWIQGSITTFTLTLRLPFSNARPGAAIGRRRLLPLKLSFSTDFSERDGLPKRHEDNVTFHFATH